MKEAYLKPLKSTSVYSLRLKELLYSKKKKGYQDQYELRYTYFSKCLVLMSELKNYHPKKLARFSLLKKYKELSRRNGKYLPAELEAIDQFLRQWE